MGNAWRNATPWNVQTLNVATTVLYIINQFFSWKSLLFEEETKSVYRNYSDLILRPLISSWNLRTTLVFQLSYIVPSIHLHPSSCHSMPGNLHLLRDKLYRHRLRKIKYIVLVSESSGMGFFFWLHRMISVSHIQYLQHAST